MGGEAAQLASSMVLLIPILGPVGVFDLGVIDSVEHGQSEIGGIGGVEQGFGSVFSAGQGQSVNLFELLSRGSVTMCVDYTSAAMLTPKVPFEMGFSGTWNFANDGRF